MKWAAMQHSDMARYECPSCGGGFPNPEPGNECPWCAASLDGSYDSICTLPGTDGPDLPSQSGLNDSLDKLDPSGTAPRSGRGCIECGATMEDRLQRRCEDCAQDAADRTVEPIDNRL